MGVNSLPKTVTRQRRCCDLNPGRTTPESSTLTTRLPSLRRVHASRKKVSLLLSPEQSVDALPAAADSVML